jgi:hypothetical protein
MEGCRTNGNLRYAPSVDQGISNAVFPKCGGSRLSGRLCDGHSRSVGTVRMSEGERIAVCACDRYITLAKTLLS